MDQEQKRDAELKEYNKSLAEGRTSFNTGEFCHIIAKNGMAKEAESILKNLDIGGGR